MFMVYQRQKLPSVDRIQGVEAILQADHSKSLVTLIYTGHKSDEFELEMSLFDALYLLSALEAMSRDGGLDYLRQPPPGSA
jgi:hypothetical protein